METTRTAAFRQSLVKKETMTQRTHRFILKLNIYVVMNRCKVGRKVDYVQYNAHDK
jgi:hypothetical protein